MSRYRTIQSALHNFLGTYTSRYSNYDGYWLFGFLRPDLGELRIDLLGSIENETCNEPFAAATNLARRKFKEQLARAGIPSPLVLEAQLSITASPTRAAGIVNGHSCFGHEVTLAATAVSVHDRTYRSESSMFVAPHNSARESRSASCRD